VNQTNSLSTFGRLGRAVVGAADHEADVGFGAPIESLQGGASSSAAISLRSSEAASARGGNGAVAGADSSVAGLVGVAGALFVFHTFQVRRVCRGKDASAE